MASLLAPVLSLLRRPRAPGSGEETPAAEATPAAPLPSLPLELAGPFYDTATLVAVSRTTKGCAASKMLSVQWAGVLSRRFPCLAALPAFQAPLADAKAVVKGLLTATPPPPEPPRRGRSRGGGSLLPSAPRDGEGRALPLRHTVILAVQLTIRGDTALTHRPVLYGYQPMGMVEDPTDDGTFGDARWHIELPLTAVDEEITELTELRCLKDALSLPDSVRLDVGSGVTNPDVRSLCRDMCRAAETNTRQDVFVVAGTDVWRMGASQATTGRSMEGCEGLLDGNFDVPLRRLQQNGADDPSAFPFVPLEIMFDNMNLAMSMVWNVGAYYRHDRNWAEPLLYSTVGRYDLDCHLCTWWDFGGSPEHDDFERHAATNTDDDDGHPYLCQLLAATRPVRVQTK